LNKPGAAKEEYEYVRIDTDTVFRLANFYPYQNYFYVLVRKCSTPPWEITLNPDGSQLISLAKNYFISTIKICRYHREEIEIVKEILVENNMNPCLDYGPSQIFNRSNNCIYYFKRIYK